jgi:5-methylcytosine-specific restriction endonuclease McrA
MNSETRDKVFMRDKFICVICGKHIQSSNSCQVAHSIKSGKGSENHITAYIWNKYRKDRSRKWVNTYIIDNIKNLSSVCSLSCNDACNIFFKPLKRDALIDLIIEEDKLFSLNTPDK